jgi:hypothetical protein
MKKEERRRPALGDERRSDYGLTRRQGDLSVLSGGRLRTTLIAAGVIAVAVLAVIVTSRSFSDSPGARRAVVAPPTDSAEMPTTVPSATAVPTEPPGPSATATPLQPDPTIVSEGLVTFVAPDGSLRILTADSSEEIIAEDVLHPAIHPDRDGVAFVRFDGLTSEIWIWDIDGGLELLGSRDGIVRNLEWSSDGDALLYHVQDDGDATTVIRRYDFFWGSADTLLASDEFSLEDASIQGFDVFPNGDLAVQVNENGASCDIYVVEAGFGYAETLTSRPDRACYSHPSVSPDGEQVAFLVHSGDGAAQVAVVDADGGDYRELATVTLADSTEDAFWPRIAWSPDSEIILYETLDDGETVYAQAADDTGGETRRLVARGHHPAWQ